jgi:predicted DCC family thiol-disulfide oxidoreductase YuxK
MTWSGWMEQLVRAWDSYWFSPSSLQRLAACRLLAFGLLIVDLLFLQDDVFWRKADPYFWQPIQVVRVFQKLLGFAPPDPIVLKALAIATVILAVGAFVGYRTRICALSSSVLYFCLTAITFSWFSKVHHTHGVLVLLLLALSLSPCGDALSIDALLKRMRASVARMRFSPEWEAGTSRYAGWPLRLIGIIVCLVYFSAGYAKLKISGFSWADGQTLSYWIIQDYYVWNPSTDFPLMVAQQIPLLSIMQAFVLFVQVTFPIILLVPRLQWFYLPAGLGFHLGTYVLMSTHFLWLWWNYMVFINWDTVGQWLKARLRIGLRPPTVDVVYDGACPLCIRSMTLIASCDWFRKLRYLDLMDWEAVSKSYPQLDRKACVDEMHVIDVQTGKLFKGFFGFRRLAWETPLLWPLLPFLYLPGISIAGEEIYGLVAGSRLRLEESCTRHTCK